uniref:Uncharacterized protein n=1 Tax=Aegilops tauschii subsp. strangulata TaxID=200361 RepID=A0A453BQB3_AEGTS
MNFLLYTEERDPAGDVAVGRLHTHGHTPPCPNLHLAELLSDELQLKMYPVPRPSLRCIMYQDQSREPEIGVLMRGEF